MALHPTRSTRAQVPQFTLPGGERPTPRMEATLSRWIASYRDQHPQMRNRTVRASYRVNGRSIRVEFPPVGRTTGRRQDSDNFSRTAAEGTRRPGLFSFLFGNRANSGASTNGVNTRAGSRERTNPNTGNVVMANGGAIRNMAIDSRLRSHLEGMARALGVRVEVFSGGQANNGADGTGSTRHNHGGAADVYIYRNGRRLTGNALAQVVNYWLSNNLGGVGYGMAHGGIHLDRHTNRARFWAYSGMPSAVRQVVVAELGRNVPALSYA